jgi:O-antigen/teichoic acid export membrane protein
VRYGREELEANGRTAAVTWARFVVTAPLLLAGASVIVGLKLAGVLPAELSWTLVALAIAQGYMQIIGEHAILLLEAAGRMKVSAVGMLCTQASVVGSIAIVLALSLGKSPVLIASIWLTGMTLVAAILTLLVARQGIWPPSFDKALRRRFLMFSAPLIAFTISQYVIKSVDLVVIRGFESAAAVGVYAVAYQGYTVIQGVATALPPVLTPLFVSLRAAKMEGNVRLYLDRVTPQLLFLASTLLALVTPLLFAVIPVIFGADYGSAARPMVILMPAAVLFFGTNVLAPIILLHERTRSVAVVNIVAAAINVIGDVVLIGPLGLGISGAAVATLLAIGALFWGYIRIARQCTSPTERFPLAVFLPVVCAAVPALALSTAAGAALGLLGAVLATFAVQIWLRPFAPQDADMIASLDMPARLKSVALRLIEALGRIGTRRR